MCEFKFIISRPNRKIMILKLEKVGTDIFLTVNVRKSLVIKTRTAECGLKAGKTLDDTINQIRSSDDFKYLNIRNKDKSITSSTKEFNTNKKSEIIIKDLLRSVPRCKICNGLIHRNSISIDRIQRKEDGGLATSDNGQITHPYFNTGYKN